MSLNEETRQKADDVRFNAIRSIVYHGARRRWLQGVDRFFTFCVILLGTATAASLSTGVVVGGVSGTAITGLAVTVIGALQLVYAFGVRAKDHELLYRDYFRLLADIDGTAEVNVERIYHWSKRLTEIASAEPPTMRVLDAIAYNEATQAIYGDEAPILKIGFWQSKLSHVLSFSGVVFDEVQPKRLAKPVG